MILIAVSGVWELAFSTTVFPHAMESGTIQPHGIIAGKFIGTIPAVTPSGLRYVAVSYPVVTCIAASPWIIVGSAHASSVGSIAF